MNPLALRDPVHWELAEEKKAGVDVRWVLNRS
jgi:hypothetical protein